MPRQRNIMSNLTLKFMSSLSCKRNTNKAAIPHPKFNLLFMRKLIPMMILQVLLVLQRISDQDQRDQYQMNLLNLNSKRNFQVLLVLQRIFNQYQRDQEYMKIMKLVQLVLLVLLVLLVQILRKQDTNVVKKKFVKKRFVLFYSILLLLMIKFLLKS